MSRSDPMERRMEARRHKEEHKLPADSLLGAIKGITEGTFELFAQRLVLARHELMGDLQAAGASVVLILAGGAVALFGYMLLNLGLVLLVGALWEGLLGMSLSALALALLNLGLGGMLALRQARRIQEGPGRLEQTRDAFKKDQEWLQEIRDKPSLQAPREP